MVTEVALSTFTRSPGKVLPLLDAGAVILTRRNAPPLRLTLADREDQADMAAGVFPSQAGNGASAGATLAVSNGTLDASATELSTLLAALLSMVTVKQLATALLATCSWMVQLPPAARRCAVAEVAASIPTADDGAITRGPGPVLTQWRTRSATFARD